MQIFADIFILSSTARIILRVYFIAALMLVCLLGDRCLHLRAKIRLLRGLDVNVASMLGWLRGFGPILTTMRLRTMPGGWMGSLMILTGLISLGCDLFTNLVVAVEMPRDCEFQTGILVSDVNSGYNPSPYGAAALYTQAAQLSRVSLGDQTGDQGIYRAFDPTKLDIFFPSDNDVIGSWICKTSSPIVSFYNKSDEAIAEELRSPGYLYPDFKPFALSNPDIQLVIISANSTIWGQPWDLKVAVDMKSDSEGISKQMQVQTCTLDTTLSWVNDIRNKINVAPMMISWAPFFSSNLFESFNSDQPDGGADSVSQTLEILLNSIIMVAGTQNAINIASGGLRYGCLLPGARFPYGVVALVFLVCSLVLFFMVYLLYLQIQLLRTKRQYDRGNANQAVSSSELCDSVPNSTLDWIVHAAHQSDNGGTRPKHHHLRDWLMSSRSHNGPRIGLVQRHGSVHNTPMSVYSQSGFSPQTNTFFSQKTGYDAVQTSEAYIPNA